MTIPLHIWHNVLTSTQTVTIGRMAAAYAVALPYIVLGWFVLAGAELVAATSGVGDAVSIGPLVAGRLRRAKDAGADLRRREPKISV